MKGAVSRALSPWFLGHPPDATASTSESLALCPTRCHECSGPALLQCSVMSQR